MQNSSFIKRHIWKIFLTVLLPFGFLSACHPEPPGSTGRNISEPEGAVVFNQACDNCHDLERALSASGDEETWKTTIQKMRDSHGAKVSDIDIATVVSFHVSRQKQEAEVFEEKCQLCHAGNTTSNKSLNRAQVAALVKKMRQKAGNDISDRDVELIINYHVREHRVALDRNVRGGLGLEKEELDPWQMIGRTVFMEKCTSCHAAQRAVGTIKDERAWRISLQRMQDYSKGQISESDIRGLVDFHVREQRRELQVFQETCTSCHPANRFSGRSMSEEETLLMLRKMQGLAPGLVTEEKVQILFLFHQRQENALAGLFEGKCESCHQFRERGEQLLPPTRQNLHKLVTRAKAFFGDLDQPDVQRLLNFHRQREQREMAVFQTSCANCHSPEQKEQKPSLSDRVMQISLLQERELNRKVRETIKTQIKYHIVERNRS